MVAPVDLAQVVGQLKLDPDDTSEDGLREALLAAALRAVENRTGRRFAGDVDPIDVEDLPVANRAVVLLVGHWYRNREAAAVGVSVTELPLAVEYLIGPISRLAV